MPDDGAGGSRGELANAAAPPNSDEPPGVSSRAGAASPMPALAVGTLLSSRYVIEEALGEGATARTYLATDTLWGGHVAIKTLTHRALSEVMRHEFSVLRGLTHPCASVPQDFGFDVAQSPPTEYLVSRFVSGVTLDEYAPGKGWEEIRTVVLDVLSALGFLHRQGLGHGDVKPSNILVDGRGRGVLIDFGCARPLGTSSNAFSGTWKYASPELRGGGVFDARADLYALGESLKQLLARFEIRPAAEDWEQVSSWTAPVQSSRPAAVSQVLEGLGVPGRLDAGARGAAPTLLGRDAEFVQLQQHLNAFTQGRSGIRWVHIWGAAGVGSSRLALELKWAAQLTAQVFEAASPRGHAIAELIGRLDKTAAPKTLLAALSQWRARAAESDRAVVVVDDVHRLDDASRELLVALVRTAEPTDAILGVSTGHGPLQGQAEAVFNLELMPLGRSSVDRWHEASGTRLTQSQLFAQSGGYPAAVYALLSTADSVHALGGVDELSLEEQQALALLAVDCDDVEALVSSETWTALAHRGRVRRLGGQFQLLHQAQRAGLLGELPADVVAWAHGVAARSLSERLGDVAPSADGATAAKEQGTSARAGWAPRLADHLAGSGDVRGAAALLEHATPAAGWATAAQSIIPRVGVLEAQERAAVLLFCARSLIAASKLELARTALNLALAGTTTQRTQALQLAAELHLRAGAPQRASRLAVRCLRDREALELGLFEPLSLLARAELSLGNYERALDLVASAMRHESSETQRVELAQVQALASMYSGQTREAIGLFETLSEQYHALGDERARGRVLSYLAITHFRRGELGLARDAYDAAFAAAQRADATDLVASSLLNRATLDQQLGRWGAALQGYERALVLARALGRDSTVLRLQFNLGNLSLQIGALEHARTALERAEVQARTSGANAVRTSTGLALGELELLRRRPDAAATHVADVLSLAAAHNAHREADEAQLLLAQIELARDAGDAAAQALSRVSFSQQAERIAAQSEHGLDLGASERTGGRQQADTEDDYRDLLSSYYTIRGQQELALGDPKAATAWAQAALTWATRTSQPLLEARAHSLWYLAARQSGEGTAGFHRDQAWRTFNRIASDLPASYRDAFWTHPERALLLESDETFSARSIDRKRLQQFLAVNRRINSTLSIDQVLAGALDAAIELLGAERGFVLLAEGEELVPRAMRNLSRAKLDDESMSFSRSIARRVLLSERAVVTVDASNDMRFRSEASVHAMQLKSVACVPFASANGPRGVLYVDNRLQMGRFTEDDSDLMLALGDQVAIALENASLHEELVRKTAALARATHLAENRVAKQERQIARLQRTVRSQQQSLETRYDYRQLVGRGPAMQRVLTVLDRVIDTDVTVLIEGESGTGKELVARAIHVNSGRAAGEFVSINCGALPENLLESELFGHKKGAFSGATEERRGLLQSASGGTVFLDEVGELPLSLQVKLLRALQERRVRPLGSTREEALDVRIVAATNRTLSDEVTEGRFREDLYFRLSVVHVEMPPLRDRPEDLPELCNVLLARLTERTGYAAPTLTRAALSKLLGHSWPGNVRELENELTRASLRSDGAILPEHIELGKPLRKRRAHSRDQYEREEAARIFEALRAQRWNVSAVARVLDMPRNTLYRKMKRYQLKRDDSTEG